MRNIVTGLALALLGSGSALAQEAPFTGAYAGVEAGVMDHHVWLSETGPGGAVLSDRYYRDKDLAGGVFAGYDFAVCPGSGSAAKSRSPPAAAIPRPGSRTARPSS